MSKPTFQPRAGAGAKFDPDKFRREYKDQRAEITRLIVEEGDIHAAMKIGGLEVEEALRRAIHIHEEDEESGSAGGACCTIDFDEIVRSAERMNQSQLYALIVIAGLLKGIFSTAPSSTDALDFLSM